MGRSEAGKTSLTQALKGEELHYVKTQYTNTEDDTIDSPGEYAESKHFSVGLACFLNFYEPRTLQSQVFHKKIELHPPQLSAPVSIRQSDEVIYQNLGLHIGTHEGENHTGESIGLLRFTPWEAVVVAADVAFKSADVEIGFMDRFCGTLILTGGLTQVKTAVEDVVRFFDERLGFAVCEVHRS